MPKKTTGKGTTKPKRYSEEFIKDALATWDKGKAEGKSAVAIAAEVGCHPSVLAYWRARKQGKPSGALAKTRLETRAQRAKQKLNGHATRPTAASAWQAESAAEVVALRREVASLREENELLTKMVKLVAKRDG